MRWLIGLLVLIPHVAGSAVLHVPEDYPTIQSGVDAAAAGDTVLVAPGTYTDQSDRFNGAGFLVTACVHLKSDVTLLSESGADQTVVELTSPGFSGFPRVMDGWFLSGLVTIDGFTVTTQVTDADGFNVRQSPRLVVRNCVFRDIGTGNVGALSVIQTDAEVYDCVFRDLALGVAGAVGGNDANRVIERCRFENIQGAALGFSLTFGVTGVSIDVRDCFFSNIQPTTGISPVFLGGNQVTFTGCEIRDCIGDRSGGLRVGGASQIVVTDNLFLRNQGINTASSGAAWLAAANGTAEFARNTVLDCSRFLPHYGGCAVYLEAGTMDLHQNAIAGCTGNPAIGMPGIGTATINSSCNVFWNNPQGNAYGFTLDSTDVDADPRFCDPAADDYTVDDLSPCLSTNSGDCGQIGAFGQGCGAVSLRGESWGAVKSRYR